MLAARARPVAFDAPVASTPVLRVSSPTVAPFFPFEAELRRIAMERALRGVPASRLDDLAARALAYAEAGLDAWSGADDADALGRAHLFRTHVAAPALQSVDAAA